MRRRMCVPNSGEESTATVPPSKAMASRTVRKLSPSATVRGAKPVAVVFGPQADATGHGFQL